MSDEKETIAVADVSAGPGGAEDAEAGTTVDVPVVELLTGRGFVTGKSGSGKSNTASVVVEKLLDNNFPVLIVDVDGEYYGLKEEYELLHAGADEECDIRVTPDHAEKLAALALEDNVPIILDVSSYLDEDDADEMVLETVKHLFAKEKKLKKPFLVLVEECHEYIPEGGGMDETGKMLIKVGKRGRKHGLGIVGISQRPADVKKDYITQCDWLVWHRLTWNNDTKVVGRILGTDYADAVEDLDDGEAFLMSDWAEEIRRVQFHRKQTFDAGATPGLDDFERPELKSVSGDLVSDLEQISEQKEARESELADLRQELDKKRQRIQELERELEEARDMSEMADTFAQALLQKAEAPHRQGGRAASPPAGNGHPGDDGPTPSPVPDASEEVRERIDAEDQSELHDYEDPERHPGYDGDADDIAAADDTAADDDGTRGEGEPAGEDRPRKDEGSPATAEQSPGSADQSSAGDGDSAPDAAATDGVEEPPATTSDEDPDDAAGPKPVRTVDDEPVGDADADDEDASEGDDHGITPEAFSNGAGGSLTAPAAASAGVGDDGAGDAESDASAEATSEDDVLADAETRRLTEFADGVELRSQEAVVRGFAAAIGEFDDVTRGMLAHYCSVGVGSPIDAHVAAGGSGDRHYAYARNRTLRQAGLVEHAARGQYQYALPELVGEVFADGVDGQTLADTVAAVESAAGLRGE